MDSTPSNAAAPIPRVLIVEDDANSRWLLCALMRRLGYQCEVAADGQEALDRAADFGPDAIVMDLMMPVLDGLEATRQLKADQRTRAIPVLALTGNATPQGRYEAANAGCDDFLAKPVVLTDLLERLQQHLHIPNC